MVNEYDCREIGGWRRISVFFFPFFPEEEDEDLLPLAASASISKKELFYFLRAG
jgi:hypothetical protein